MKTNQKILVLEEKLNQVELVLAEAIKMLDIQSKRIISLEKENKEVKIIKWVCVGIMNIVVVLIQIKIL